jgi:hypothetical protein
MRLGLRVKRSPLVRAAQPQDALLERVAVPIILKADDIAVFACERRAIQRARQQTEILRAAPVKRIPGGVRRTAAIQ